jgi:hypothetical protein
MINVEDSLALSLRQNSSLDADEKQDATHLILANMRPAFIIFEDNILLIGSNDKDEKTPLHHPCVNKHQSWWTADLSHETMNNHGCKMMSLSHWR